MKNKRVKIFKILILMIPLLLIVVIMSAIFLKNDNIEKIADARENEKKADITATTDSRFTYTVNSDGTSITLTKYIGTDTDVIIPSTIDGYTVTSFAQQLLWYTNFGNAENIVIPSTVISLYGGNSSTWGSNGGKVKNITVDDNNEYYSSIDGVLFNKDKTKIIRYPSGKTDNIYYIPNTVTNIESNAFYACSNLIDIKIPSSVTSIGQDAFYNCISLTSIEISSSVTSIGKRAFNGCTSLTSIEIPSSVISIENYAFYDCTSLVSIEIPSSIISIGNGVFNGCTSLTSINVDSRNQYFTSINGVLFNKEKIIRYPAGKIEKNYIIPSSVTSIGDYAFEDCKNLISIEIPSSVTSIGDHAFEDCENLISIEIPSSVTSIGYAAFYDCTSLTSIEIPSSVTSIGDLAFYYCTSLTSIEIPSSVTSIGDWAFRDCKSLTSIKIPSSVTSIGKYAFYNCKSLTSIEIPSSVTNIGTGAFRDCKKLTIYCESNSVAHQYAIDNNISYKLVERTLEAITVKTKPTKTTYIEGENLDLTGGVLTLTYNNNTIGTVSMTDSKVTTSGFDSTTAGTKTITVSYGGKSTTFTVTVNEKTLSSISVKTKPSKTTYKQGENLNLAGGQLTLTYNNNTTETVNMTDSKVTTSGFDSTTAGTKTITVSYERKTTTFDINIIQNINYEENEDGGITITGGNETEVIIPEEINGKSVTEIGDKAFADRDDLISVDIPDSVTKIADSAFEGSDDVTIICNSGSKAEDFAKEKDMNYILKDKTVDSISIKKEPTKTTYVKDEEELDLKGGRILLKYTDGDTSPISMKFTGVKVTGYDKTKAGQQELTVTFREKTTTFNVTVNAKDEPILGDISGDGKVDSTDLLLLKRHIIAGNKTEWVLKEDKFTRGDMNTDGTINSTDLLLLKRKIINR